MRIRRFGHAGLEVGNLAASEAFYGKVFGFEVTARYPGDGEVMLAVGQGDHLLLHSAADDPHNAAAAGGPGLNHVAFQLEEGHRQIPEVRRRLTDLGIDFVTEDHDGDASVYFGDPDGNLLEVYSAPGSTPRFGSSEARRAAARGFLYANARPVDRAVYEHRFEGAAAERVLAALAAHRNPDGGFGHALEPDVRAPQSQPIHTLTALELLREAGIRSSEIAGGCCRFLSSIAREDAAVPALLPGALDYPAAAHWQGPFAFEPSLGWTLGLAAELQWHGAADPWAARAAQACMAALEPEPPAEAHLLLYRFRFAGAVLTGAERERELARCQNALSRAEWFVPETPVRRYGLTPLHYAPAPNAPARPCFDEGLIDAHLADLLDAQQGDGGWPIRFQPPTEAAAVEWRARWTLEALEVLSAYGRL